MVSMGVVPDGASVLKQIIGGIAIRLNLPSREATICGLLLVPVRFDGGKGFGSQATPGSAGLYQRLMTIPIRGTAALVVAAAVVAATAIWLPTYRWFLLISIGIGLVIAGGLVLWHRLRPVKEEDVENKRPLGLS